MVCAAAVLRRDGRAVADKICAEHRVQFVLREGMAQRNALDAGAHHFAEGVAHAERIGACVDWSIQFHRQLLCMYAAAAAGITRG